MERADIYYVENELNIILKKGANPVNENCNKSTKRKQVEDNTNNLDLNQKKLKDNLAGN